MREQRDFDISLRSAGQGKTIGLIVNPVAGMGGRVGLKGTDGPDILREAIRRGAVPVSSERASIALKRLAALVTPFQLITGAGELGEDAARAAGIEPIVVYTPSPGSSRPDDTRNAALVMAYASVDLILFAGGDGTARDVLGVVNDRVPILGIPTGVKMYSAVFGTNSDNAGNLAARVIAGESSVRFREAEVMDIDEAAMRNDQVSARLYGYARSPHERHLVQNAKAGSVLNENLALDAVARQVVRQMKAGWLYLLGPGTTTRRIMTELGLPSTLLGVDAVMDGALVGADLNEQALIHLIEGQETRIIVGVLGGHGSLFGRGNQQISAEVIRRTGRENIIVITSMDKLISLDAGCLRVDTGDAEVDAMLSGHIRVHTGPDRSVFFRVRS
ncbi:MULTISPECIES: ATP-NAD kinase family protein [Pseudomonas]|jgi:predicted polyphosphate/ATP-dependent NAD kinase|uniref:ATP-NAD kinase family protein n=2 Tax=Pseudomonas veronii TaxID=76761 RepID=A0A7Y1A0W0_PSEVE|nr:MULTISPECIES: ATP-NAD kinase family protein [Pseudomonas]MDY7553214.1 ATP-NAD kinase family protein [Pseudomonas sp. FG1]MEB0049255.1 ATP-NAD kinase family protein [Pseudomonas sp. FG1]NMY07036.1 ATP-NAD kinase family protein [Pseudomonas veronii]PMU92083.1 NAD+ kinase [Pseudomonas sp. GW704-F3]PMU97771.1 NAD+ kinase [Pseudomonas sp. GW704-F5]